MIVHSCDINAARLMALRENGKTRLPMKDEEKRDAAWVLVRIDLKEYSKKIIVTVTGVSDGTVGNMRRTRRRLLESNPDAALPESWAEAMAALKGREDREYTEEEREQMIAMKVAKLDEQIGKLLGDMASRQVEAACEVVAKRLGRQGLRHLVEHFAGDILDEMTDPYGLHELNDVSSDDEEDALQPEAELH
ncbi:hypothetical protein AIOL_003410 [Candidatus Rhodobacter oscarellae]|uniref:Uncharacterized protein n=1 Tax=Candidatus Rhodobacter oscarellae TaxID=1675527 RepID=A0A0J9E6W7_9RHOB|nr:hypothetical protein AIOL_003410 [Candidatus Rhodobacter lobularis]